MKSYYILLCISVCHLNGIGQTPAEKAAIQAFKANHLKGVELLKTDTLVTSAAILTRCRARDYRIITTTPKSQNREHFEYYFNDTDTLESELDIDSVGLTGICTKYDPDASIVYTIDYDKGVWIVYKDGEYPYIGIQKAMKAKADSLITKMYGRSFLSNNVIWSISSTYIRSSRGGGIWTDTLTAKPTSFLFRYNLKLDSTHIYQDAIEFELDSTGGFIPNQYEEVYGFEKLPASEKKGFTLTYENAIRLAKKYGLSENHGAKATGFLQWVCSKSPNLFNGHFEYYVLIETSTSTTKASRGQVTTTTKYDVYSFNPWTSAFNGKRKMKTINFRESMGGVNSGLLPDK
jgi:hypothetical protein